MNLAASSCFNYLRNSAGFIIYVSIIAGNMFPEDNLTKVYNSVYYMFFVDWVTFSVLVFWHEFSIAIASNNFIYTN